MYLITGGGGFIGSNLVRTLNERGMKDILIVEDTGRHNEFPNLADCTVADCIGIDEFRKALRQGAMKKHIEVIFHQGACTDTMESDETYMMDNNAGFSKELLHFALSGSVPMVYASSAAVYGTGEGGAMKELPENEEPLNVYGVSKLAFDEYVRTILGKAKNTLIGLRYYNVYGPAEAQKGRMASMIYQLYRQLVETGVARLFEGTDGYADGEQRRDFIFVADVVRVNLFFAERPHARGIFNVGTGSSRSFNDVPNILIKLLGGGRIEYIPFDRTLTGKYQSFTEADLTALRAVGYEEPFTTLEAGIEASVKAWQS